MTPSGSPARPSQQPFDSDAALRQAVEGLAKSSSGRIIHIDAIFWSPGEVAKEDVQVRRFWTFGRKLAGFIVGVVSLVAGVIAIWQALGA